MQDIKNRMERVYLSIGQRFDEDIKKRVKLAHKETAEGGKITISFDDGNKSEILNQIFLIIANVAKLKDHLKARYRLKGGKNKIIEDEINRSEHLKLIIDLDNLEKHGSYKNRCRSGKFPHITNVSRGLSVKANNSLQSGSFMINPFTGDFKVDNVAIVITAEVKDNKGSSICYFDELIEKSIQKWEEIINKYQLLEA